MSNYPPGFGPFNDYGTGVFDEDYEDEYLAWLIPSIEEVEEVAAAIYDN